MAVHANCCNHDGITPLHVATLRGYEDIASLLLRKGASPCTKNHTHEQTPLHLACQYNHYKVGRKVIGGGSSGRRGKGVTNALPTVSVASAVFPYNHVIYAPRNIDKILDL